MKNDNVEDVDEEVDVFKLILKLRQEKLLIRTEKQYIQELNSTIRVKTHEIIRDSWITTKQRLLLYQRESTTRNYQKLDHLLKSEFIDAKQVLGFKNTLKIGNLLQVLRSQPAQLAKWLIAGEQLSEDPQGFSFFMENIVVGLYGCLMFSEDIKYMLALLYELAKLQLLNCEDPRRIMKQRTCSFKHLYFLFHEVLQSAKFFLSAAIELPIVQMMSCTDYYLDLDPEKTVMRFKQDENEVTNIFKSVEEYRNEVVAKLVEFSNMIISSLSDNVYSFPKSISWIVSRIAKIIEKSFSSKQANAIITELIFNLYICPVIIDPEQYGICTTQVNEIARHNLIQICQILQSLALRKYEPIDARYSDVFDLLDKNRVCHFIELLFFEMDCAEPPIETSPCLARDIMLFTESELNNMISILQRIQVKRQTNDTFDKDLSIEEQLASFNISADTTNSPKSNRSSNNDENVSKLSNFFALGTKNHTDALKNYPIHNQALVFPIEQAISDPIGLLPEEKIIEASTVPLKNGNVFDGGAQKVEPSLPETPPQNGDLKQSFTYQDEGSIGNTSDNLEAISEAASNHSVDSSIELENEDQNDNLSDMVSANVSGRGTPNISGRDTPSSQVCENDDRAMGEPRQAEVAQPQSNLNLNRQIRSEIDDKFCKFEIKKLLEGDETISIISETWSTDVLASDNETLDAGESRQPLQLAEAIQEVPNILDLSETQSESAWSTDVMTSDSERLTEVDNDDSVSVAQSDETRSEIDDNVCASRRLSTCSNSFVPISTNQNYVSSVTVHNMSFLPTNGPASGVNTKNKYVSSSSSTSSFTTEYKNDKSNRKVYETEQTDNNANRVFKALTLEQSESLSEGNEIKTSIYKSEQSESMNEVKSSIFKSTIVKNGRIKDTDMNNLAGPSGIAESEKSHRGRPNEILLSNCSLNSSSSGSSSHSFENKNSSEQWESKQWLNSSGSSLNVTLTPSESTSELSVLSIGKKTARGLKPSVSTGAIPKSISFDMSADKGLDEDGRSKRGGFFGKLRMGFKNRRGKSLRNQDEFRLENDDFVGRNSGKIGNNTEASDDILAKYRTKPFTENETIKENCDSSKSLKGKNVYRNNSEELNSFNDIKNKLRLVLSDTWEIPHYVKNYPFSIRNKIDMLLRLEMGKARRLREWSDVARISEAIRCVNLLNDDNCLKLLRSMRGDIVLRSTYIKYLAVSKQELLFCKSYLNSLQKQITNDKYQCEKYLAAICVKEFLSEQESMILEFCDEFKQLSLADEKCDLLKNFYSKLFLLMKSSSVWKGIICNREKTLKITLERFIMSKTYKNSIYPNGDGDRHRDLVLHNHIEKLSKIITPDHKDLDIDKMYLRECPWLPAQDALRALNVYITPRDKVKCIVHCAKCIMDLLSLSQTRSSATADDFMPVLVYVIIKVNPEALLSTVQYVNSFFHNQLFGEEEYWWTQFCAAVEYIKTMDYSD